MAAIVTNKFRVNNAAKFKQSITDAANSVYVAIGKSDAWSDSLIDFTDADAPTPQDQQKDERNFYNDMMAMKLLTAGDVTHVIPRYNWVSGNAYTAWDDRDSDIYDKAFYVITDEFKVYKCIATGPGASVIQPTQTNINEPVAESDGFLWKFMFTTQAADADRFVTNNFIPVKTVVIPAGGSVGDLTTDDQTQYSGQLAAEVGTNGAIYHIQVTNGGSGFTSKPTITIDGDGTGAVVNAGDITLTSQSITSIKLTSFGQDYSNAVVNITGGGGIGATAYAVLTPDLGHGGDPVAELGAFFVTVNSKLDGDEGNGDFVVDNDFRQVGVVMNPFTYGTTSISTSGTLGALSSFTLSGHSGFTEDDYITGTTSSAIAYIDAYDNATGELKYHQNDKTGYGVFEVSETITGSLGGTGTINTLNNPEVERFSGQVLFIESRAPINRAATQIEDIKVIIEF